MVTVEEVCISILTTLDHSAALVPGRSSVDRALVGKHVVGAGLT